jgi:hypothetical protein
MGKAALYNWYPVSSIAVYNGTTLLHFVVGGLVLLFSSRFFGTMGIAVAALYLSFSLLEMYVMMPRQVCRNCVYFRLENALCISGLNVAAKRFAKPGNPEDFPRRATGVFCPNNLYIFSLAFPIACGIPILVFNFSPLLLSLELFLFVLLATRFMIIIPRLACVHCLSKFVCPQAGLMGVREK